MRLALFSFHSSSQSDEETCVCESVCVWGKLWNIQIYYSIALPHNEFKVIMFNIIILLELLHIFAMLQGLLRVYVMDQHKVERETE